MYLSNKTNNRMEKFVIFISPSKGKSGYIKSYTSADIYTKTPDVEQAMLYATPSDAMVHAVSTGEKFSIIKVKVSINIENIAYA